MPFQLTIAEGKSRGKDFFFDQPRVRIGRLPENDLILYDTGVSRYHCEIVREPDGWYLRDTGSANGTTLNGGTVSSALIGEGDRLGVGPITFLFRETAEIPGDVRLPTGPMGQQSLARPDATVDRQSVERHRTSTLTGVDLDRAREELANKAGPGGFAMVRTSTGGYRTYGRSRLARLRDGLAGNRMVFVALVALAIIGLTATAMLVGQKLPRRDRSNEIFDIEPALSGVRFGQGPVDVRTQTRAHFRFPYDGGHVRFVYRAHHLDTPGELRILVNGRTVGTTPRSPAGEMELGFDLPPDLLLTGPNVVTFEPVHVSPKDPWIISDVSITPSSPPTSPGGEPGSPPNP